MSDDPFLEKIEAEMDRLGVTQAQLATACNYTQSYICKLLKKKTDMTVKAKRKLTAWLDRQSHVATASDRDIYDIVKRLMAAKPERRIHIMNILRCLADMP